MTNSFKFYLSVAKNIAPNVRTLSQKVATVTVVKSYISICVDMTEEAAGRKKIETMPTNEWHGG